MTGIQPASMTARATSADAKASHRLMPEWLIGILGTVVAAALGFLTWIASRRSDDRERIKALEARQDKQDERNLKWQNYAGVLRAHINNGKPPPAPDFPDGLFD